MAKSILGVDIGSDSLTLALCRDGELKKGAVEQMPNGLIRDSRITSTQAMGEFLRETLKKNHIHALYASLVLPDELCFVRTVTMPRMTIDQLKYNIPFEFSDYITEEPKNYIFDYAMLTDLKKDPEGVPTEGGAANVMELMAVATQKAVLDEGREMLSKAGLKLLRAAPIECAYISLIRDMQRCGSSAKEYCILDLGYRSIRMFMYKGDRHMVTRVLEMGIHNLDQVVAEATGVDIHLAHTYFMTNYEDCQNKDFCAGAYNNIATELMRALNFYRFSNQDSELADVWLCGGGASVPGLCRAIADSLDMRVHTADEMIRSRISGVGWYMYTPAVGITMD